MYCEVRLSQPKEGEQAIVTEGDQAEGEDHGEGLADEGAQRNAVVLGAHRQAYVDG